MKNKKLKLLSIFLSVCVLGTSSASAAEFSSGSFSPEGELTTENAEEEITQGEKSAAENMPEDFEDSEDSQAEEFDSSEEFSEGKSSKEEFSDEETDPSEEDEIPEAEDYGPGAVETDAAQYKRSAVEAELEADPSVKTQCNVYDAYNLESQDYSMYGLRVSSYLTDSPDGGLMRVQFGVLRNQVLVEYYDTSYNIKETVTVPQALPVFGGFYESNNNYYILTGQDNESKSDSAEVYRVTKYSKDWKVQGSASLYGEHTQYVFGFGSARMAMYNNQLFVRTCHIMYNEHQANVSFSVNTDTMTVVDKLTGVGYGEEGYASHSFNEFIQVDNGQLITLDQCDAYPSRALFLLKYNMDISEGKFVPKFNFWFPHEKDPTYCDRIDVLKIPGSSGTSYMGVSAGALEYSDSSYLIAGNYDSVQSDSNSPRNVFVASVPKSGGEPVIRYFLDYAGTTDSASTPHLVKTGSNSFVLLWSSKGKVYYTAIDGNGQKTGKTYSMTGNLSDCVPSVINGKLIWYSWKQERLVFYEISLSDLSQNHAVKIVNGHKPVYGEKVTNGMVTKTCSVCKKDLGTVGVPISVRVSYKKETQSTFGWMENSVSMDPGSTMKIHWYPTFMTNGERLNDCEVISSAPEILSVTTTGADTADLTAKGTGTVTLTVKSKYNPAAVFTAKILVGTMDESIYTLSLSQGSFAYDGTEHKPTVKLYRQGKEVDAKSYKVTYKGDLVNAGTASVTITGTGSLSGSLTKEFKITPADLSKCTVSVSKEKADFTGTKIEPDVTVKFGDKTLKKTQDYLVNYTNNINPGKATVKVTGTGNFTGTVVKYFTIVKNTEKQKDISKCKITVNKKTLVYNGKEQKPGITVKDGTKKLTLNEDYTVAYSNNINAGKATVTVKGKNTYAGTLKTTFVISRAQGKVLVSKKTVNVGSEKYNLSDYITTDGKITCKSSNPSVVKISGNKFIAKKAGKATLTISAKQGKNYLAVPKTKIVITTVVTVPVPQNFSVSTDNSLRTKAIWEKVQSVNGYEIQYSKSQDMKAAQTVTAKGSASAVSLKNLERTFYYVRIRAYKTVNGKKYYSQWTEVVKINDPNLVEAEGVIFDLKNFPEKQTVKESMECLSIMPQSDINPGDVTYVIDNGNAQQLTNEKTPNLLGSKYAQYKCQYYVSDWNNMIAYIDASYEEGMYLQYRVEIYAQMKKGSFPVSVYYKGHLLRTSMVTVKSVDQDVLDDRAEISSMEEKAWTSPNMTPKEKLDALKTYIEQNYTSKEYNAHLGSLAILYAARDLGLNAYYHFLTWSYDYEKGYGDEYYHNGCAFAGGPVCTMVIIDGKKYIYEVEGKK